MAQGKQAKVLSEGQIKAALASLESSRYPLRDRVLFLLSTKAGLRAKEIAKLQWWMVTDAEGILSDCINLDDQASKGNSGRTIPMHKQLIHALSELQQACTTHAEDFVIVSERGSQMQASSVVKWFQRLYESLAFDGCSSHSGRRTFITNAARKVSLVGASLRDVQQLAGHSSLNTTQRYMEGDSEAKRKLIALI
jgi:integrase